MIHANHCPRVEISHLARLKASVFFITRIDFYPVALQQDSMDLQPE
jgi:hypothetical protein